LKWRHDVDRIQVNGIKTIVANDLIIDVVGESTLTFDWLRGGEVIVNNKSDSDCIITSERPISGESTYTLTAGASSTFVYDDEYYVKSTTVSIADIRVELTTLEEAVDVLEVGAATPVIDTLVSTSETSALSANQGKALQDGKVDKDGEKVLSTNDFTDAYKLKLDGGIIVEATTAKTLALTDKDKFIKCTSSSAVTITVPPNSSVAFAVGDEVSIAAYGSGTVTISAGSGVTVNSKDSNLAIDGQYSSVILKKMATDEWILVGALT